jgi:acetyl/propionyl-CoA carboxylase alpha subunit
MREDTGIEQGNEISIYYDSMISKLVAYAADRKSVIAKMKRALKDFRIVGVNTNINFLLSLLDCPEYVEGNYNSQFVERTFLPRLAEQKTSIQKGLELAVMLSGIIFKESNDIQAGDTLKQKNSLSNWTKKRVNIFQ